METPSEEGSQSNLSVLIFKCHLDQKSILLPPHFRKKKRFRFDALKSGIYIFMYKMESSMKKENTLRKKEWKNPAKKRALQKIVSDIRTEVKYGSIHYLEGSKVPFGGE